MIGKIVEKAMTVVGTITVVGLVVKLAEQVTDRQKQIDEENSKKVKEAINNYAEAHKGDK